MRVQPMFAVDMDIYGYINGYVVPVFN